MKKHILILVSLLLIFTLSACGEQKAYNQAQSLMDAGEYEKAAEAFTALGDYEDSAEKAKAAENKHQYIGAQSLMDAGEYEKAAEAFTALGDYEDSAEKAKAAENKHQYIEAQSLMDAGEYEKAAEVFTALGDYEDSAEKKNDCSFLTDIRASILNRRDQNARGTDYSTLTNTELSYVGKYSSATFADSTLKGYALDYIQGLNDQKAALKVSTDKSEYQIKWRTGMVERYEVLCKLYEEYGLLKDDHEFIGTHVTNLENEQEYLNALCQIDEDLNSQLDGIMFDYIDNYHFGATYVNHTNYSFDMTVKFSFYQVDENKISDDMSFDEQIANGMRLGESTNYINSIKAGSTNYLKFYTPTSDWNQCEFFWTISEIVKK